VTSNITNIAKNLRKRSTDTERLLWRYLRIKQIEGLKFRRQESIGNYIADFVCFEAKVVVEVDGGQHTASEKDTERDAWLQSQGFRVLRFWTHEVLTNIKGVLEVIRQNCMHRLYDSPSPTPPIKGGAINNEGQLLK
jgi:very-short-patch-repair endonuclease